MRLLGPADHARSRLLVVGFQWFSVISPSTEWPEMEGTEMALTGSVASVGSLEDVGRVRDVIGGRYLGVYPGLFQTQQLFPSFVNITGVSFDSFDDHGQRTLFRFMPHVYEHVQRLHQLRNVLGVYRGHGVFRKVEHQDQRQRTLSKNFLCFHKIRFSTSSLTEYANRNGALSEAVREVPGVVGCKGTVERRKQKRRDKRFTDHR